eukprot:CAMPEP_0113686524 /NCGR_PEP_ID=MMETSP0038_2-20120614/15341_1 /TAXON_ID=2898 /ORGANISM="Cryptomonas paramecium" /LENGTH=362 /DNA_ID=CAMNT_0000606863 /DNA_START=110 /DNA_END=1195 /DNA_ORIENTATION=- /assembly_acc=CAM_ASM_000170
MTSLNITPLRSPLDPFLQKLTKEYTDDADLSRRLMNYFYEMDTDGSGLMTFSELSHQLKHLDFRPPIHITHSDFAVLTQNGTLCNEREEMTPSDFENAIRIQMKLFLQRKSSDLLAMGDLSEATESHLETLKMVMAAQQRLERSVEKIQRMADGVQQAVLDMQHAFLELQADLSDPSITPWPVDTLVIASQLPANPGGAQPSGGTKAASHGGAGAADVDCVTAALNANRAPKARVSNSSSKPSIAEAAARAGLPTPACEVGEGPASSSDGPPSAGDTAVAGALTVAAVRVGGLEDAGTGSKAAREISSPTVAIALPPATGVVSLVDAAVAGPAVALASFKTPGAIPAAQPAADGGGVGAARG